MSVYKALEHSAFRCNRKLEIKVCTVSHQRIIRLNSGHICSGLSLHTLNRVGKNPTPHFITTPGVKS